MTRKSHIVDLIDNWVRFISVNFLLVGSAVIVDSLKNTRLVTDLLMIVVFKQVFKILHKQIIIVNTQV